MNLTIQEIANTIGSNQRLSDTEVTGFAVDSRIVAPGEVFFCIRGDKSDGHDYTKSAASKGAILIIAEKKTDSGIPEIIVESTPKALIQIAHYYINKFDLDVVGITGSAGKTTTKELTAQILDRKYRVAKNFGNQNTPVGIPISLKHIKSDTEIFVAEMSGAHFDEIPRLLQILTPRIATVTNVGETHLERLGDISGVAKAKGHIIEALPVGGIAILNVDDPNVVAMKEKTRCKITTIGIKNKADITGKILDGRFIFTHKDEIYSIKPKTPTVHFLYDSLIAAAIGIEYGVKLIDSIEVIESFEPVKGRGRIVVSSKGINIVDETYNANPVSMRETLKALEQKDGRKFAILADMLELGKNTEEIHKNLGSFISDLRLDGVFCYGELSENITAECPMATHFNDIEELINVLNQKLKKDDWVLVKGSNSMNMIKVVENIK